VECIGPNSTQADALTYINVRSPVRAGFWPRVMLWPKVMTRRNARTLEQRIAHRVTLIIRTATLSDKERQLVEDVMRDHPLLTRDEAIEHLVDSGM